MTFKEEEPIVDLKKGVPFGVLDNRCEERVLGIRHADGFDMSGSNSTIEIAEIAASLPSLDWTYG